jgi:hypothetical protein
MNINDIIKEYSLDTQHTNALKIEGLDRSTHVFKVAKKGLPKELYIIDTPAGRSISMHPHIVGKNLDKLAFSAAIEAAKAIRLLVLNDKESGGCKLVFENVLRAAPGYKLLPALRRALPHTDIRETFIRPKYVMASYRNHRRRVLKAVYKDFSMLPRKSKLILIKPDTEATGVSGKLAIESAIIESKKRDSKITDIILYGFISISALKLLKEVSANHGIKLHAFSIENVTELAFNNYDMTVYGIDESYFSKYKKKRKLRSIIDKTTLQKYLPWFIPGCDQPGDWSSRQSLLFTGRGYEKGDIKKHLIRSAKFIENLREISSYEVWQKNIATKELKKIKSILSRLNKNKKLSN